MSDWADELAEKIDLDFVTDTMGNGPKMDRVAVANLLRALKADARDEALREKDSGKLDFDTSPAKFPHVWNAGENKFDDLVINKHVYLALRQYLEEMAIMETSTEDGDRAGIWLEIDDGNIFEKVIDVEKMFTEVKPMFYDPEQLRAMADSLHRASSHLQRLASEQDGSK